MEWTIAPNLTDYQAALAEMESRVGAIIVGSAPEKIWLVEHPPLYTAGTSAQPSDLLEARFPVHQVGRGGQYTYHGPGQRVGYVMLDLKARMNPPDIRKFVWMLEEWIIRTLAAYGVDGQRREGRVGIWVVRPDGGEDKIAALGIRVRKWVTFHGIAINVNPDLSHFLGIVPCGIREHGVTSLAKLGKNPDMNGLDATLKEKFTEVFGA